MKTAIVYYSLNGNTEQTANKIAEKIGADLIPVRPVKAYPDTGFAKLFWGGKSVVISFSPILLMLINMILLFSVLLSGLTLSLRHCAHSL